MQLQICDYQLVSKKVKDDIVSGDMKVTFLYHVLKKKKKRKAIPVPLRNKC